MNIDFEKQGGLVPAIVQDARTNKVLMLGYMNREAYEQSLTSGRVTFYSRSRQALWVKGETSGNFLNIVKMEVDCDGDTLLIQAHPEGPTCHTGTGTCWGEQNQASSLLFLEELQQVIEKRRKEMPEGSYTTRLFTEGINKIAQKVGEEALEAVIEATNGSNERLIYEGSDLLYHLLVMLTHKGLRITDLTDELRVRHAPGWERH